MAYQGGEAAENQNPNLSTINPRNFNKKLIPRKCVKKCPVYLFYVFGPTNVLEKYNIIVKDRNVKDVKCNKEELEKFKNELMLQSNMENFESKDFNDIKDDFKSEYESEEKILKEQRNKVNSIINSLNKDVTNIHFRFFILLLLLLLIFLLLS